MKKTIADKKIELVFLWQ